MVTCVHALFDQVLTTTSMSYWLFSRFTAICYIVKRCEVWCLVGDIIYAQHMLQVQAEMQKNVLGEDVSPKKSSEYVLSPHIKKLPRTLSRFIAYL